MQTPDERFAALRDSLTNHTPSDADIETIKKIRSMAAGLGYIVVHQCPPGREQSLALTKLEECVMWAVKSVVLPRESGNHTHTVRE